MWGKEKVSLSDLIMLKLRFQLEEMNKRVLASYDDLGQLCLEAGLKEQKATRVCLEFFRITNIIT